VLYAVAITVTAGGDTAVHEAGIVLLQNDQALVEQNVDDGSPGVDSVRYAGIYSGSGISTLWGPNSTQLQGLDIGTVAASAVRETTAGQGSRLVGFDFIGVDDTAAVHLAIKEVGGAGPAAGAFQ
jgi:hypothetical protein